MTRCWLLPASFCLATLMPSAILLAAEPTTPPRADAYFQIRVVDDQTGRGVPLVELETVNRLHFFTDSAGRVAFFEPGLMDRSVFFFVRSHGYEFPKDGFGFAGTRLTTKPGTTATLKLPRVNVAERLYRVTGEGIYRDSVLLGEKSPIAEPLLNAQVSGQDSVQVVPYRGKLYWFWGDTSRPAYPLGHFGTAGATSDLPERGALDPAVGVDLTYFKDADGFSRPMCPWDRPHPVWIDGLLTTRDETGRQRLVTHYSVMESLSKRLEHGLAVFNDETNQFDKATRLDAKQDWQCPQGNPIRPRGVESSYVYFIMPRSVVRVLDDWKAIQDSASYEAFTCLAEGAAWSGAATAKLDRGPDGRLRYAWKKDTAPIGQQQEAELLKAGKIDAKDARWQITDVATGKPVMFHYGSIHWNAYRKKWLWLAVEQGGTSYLGEVWLAEADSPLGPWAKATKILTHDRYSFYNPVQHPFFDQQEGRMIYFEGTYAETFSGNPVPTPRYDYNQVMYRLDLADPRLEAARK